MRPGCKARVEGDELYCHACGLRWDRSEDPPLCSPVKPPLDARTEEELAKLYAEANE